MMAPRRARERSQRMADDEKPGKSGAWSGADDTAPEGLDAGEEAAAGGKLIHADVFLSRLAERQDGPDFAGGEAKVVDAILGALESLGFDPDVVAPEFVRMAREASSEDDADAGAEPHSLEDMAVEELFLSELRTGRKPSLSAYMRRHAAQRGALLRMAMRMDPNELAGFDAPDGITPDEEAAARAGQEAGTRRALRVVARRGLQRGRDDARRVAEERAPYDAGHPGEAGEEQPEQGRPRVRPARPEESEPER
jgi:hypothetical protein